jgi:hypothetical protein
MSHFTHHYEENYLKAIFKLGQKPVRKVNNIALARYLELNPGVGAGNGAQDGGARTRCRAG